jgi:hypothetical protein
MTGVERVDEKRKKEREEREGICVGGRGRQWDKWRGKAK